MPIPGHFQGSFPVIEAYLGSPVYPRDSGYKAQTFSDGRLLKVIIPRRFISRA